MRWVAPFLFFLTFSAPEVLFSHPGGDSLGSGGHFLRVGNDHLKRQSYDSALVNLAIASRLFMGVDGEGYLRSEGSIARVLHAKGMVDSASGVLSRALALVDGLLPPLSQGRADAYTLQSLIHSYYGRSDSAILLAERSLGIRSALFGPAHSSLSTDYYTLGLAYKNRGMYREALSSLRKSAELFADDGKPNASKANISAVLGNTLREVGRFDEAFGEFQKAYAELKRQGLERTNTMATVLCYEAYARSESGSLTEALALYQRCLTLIEEIEPSNQTMLLVVRIQLGEIYSRMGDVEKGIDFFENTLRQSIRENRPPAMVAELRQYAARAYMEAGRTSRAVSYADTALALKKRVLGRDNPDVASARELIADICTGAKMYARALRETHEAIRIRSLLPGSSRRPDLASLWVKKGDLERALGRWNDAEQSVHRAMAFEEGTSPRNPLLVSRAFETLGDIHRGRKRSVEAKAMYDSAVAHLFSGIRGRSPVAADIESDMTKGIPFLRLLRKSGLLLEGQAAGNGALFPLREALRRYLLAGEVLFHLRNGFDSEGAKVRTLEEYSDVIERGIHTAYQAYSATGEGEYARTALELAEGNRAGLLMEGIRSSHPDAIAGIPDDLLRRERLLRAQLTALELSLAKTLQEASPDTAKSVSLAKAISEQREELWSVRDDLRRHPQYLRLFSPESFFSAAALQSGLDDSTLVIEYYLGEKKGYVFAFDQRTVRMGQVGDSPQVQRSARRFLTAIRTLDGRGTSEAGRELEEMILRPVRQLIRTHPRLIIIPDRDLSRIPFEALRAPWNRDAYLVASHEIAYALSARMIYRQGEEGRENGSPSFAGFAPVFADSVPATVVPPALLASLGEGELRSLTMDGKQLRALNYTKGEVNGIAAEFSQRGVPASSYLFGRATKAAFNSAAATASYLHIATHGVVNEKDPRLSALLFAASPDSARSGGEALYAAEAYNLSLNAKLVVLSCCDGGVGRYVAGEGVYALARGFICAGARSVSYSLWKVMDRQTSDLMQDFYGGLLAGKRYARALQLAKIKMISRPEMSAPYNWAGFVLMGDGRLVTSPGDELSHVE